MNSTEDILALAECYSDPDEAFVIGDTKSSNERRRVENIFAREIVRLHKEHEETKAEYYAMLELRNQGIQLIKDLLVFAEHEEAKSSSRIGHPVTLAAAARGRDWLDALDDHTTQRPQNDSVPVSESGRAPSAQHSAVAAPLPDPVLKDGQLINDSAPVRK